MKLFTNVTKPFVLFLLLFALGVGQMWGDDVYIYYMNVNDWEGVKCHNWGVSGTEWCNAEANMSSTVMTKDNHTYYKIKLKDPGNTSCKFYNHTCNTDGSTGDLTISGNCYQGGQWIDMLPITGGTIFYDNSSTDWVPTGDDKVQFFVGDGGYTSVYDMTKIDNTKLYYKNMSSYGGATYLRFAKANYESNGFNADNVPTTSTDIYTGTYEFNSNSLYLFTTTNNDEHPDITTKYIGSDGSLSELNFTITLKAKVKAFGSASYVAGATKGNLNASSYKFSEYNTCGTSTGASPVVASGSTSGDFDAGYTAETSLSVTSITPGYTFRGWYDSDGNKLSDDTEYTAYLPKKTTDVYAYFEEDSWSVAFSNDGNGTVTEPNSTPRTVGQITGIDINASAAFGYQFSTWTSSTGGSFDAAGTANTKFYPTAATTVTANFARRYAYIEANFQVYDATRSSRTPVGNVSWKDDSRAIEMAYDGTNRRYYLHTYSTPAQLAERLNDADAYFYIKTTSSSSSTFTDAVSYYADGSSNQSLSAAGSANQKDVTTSSSANSFKFTGSDNGYVILYFDGTHVWYELEYGVTYIGNGNTGGTVPTDAAYYSGGATVTVKADPDSWAKTGYSFGGWTTADGGSGSNYNAGGTFAISQNTTLYAKWTQTVTLDKNGGSKDGSVDVIFHGTTTSSLSAPAKTGYHVEAYYADDACTDSKKVLTDNGNLVNYTGYVESNKWVHGGETTLYANWTPNTYTVRFENLGADAGHKGSWDTTVTFNDTINMKGGIEVPSKTHYDFGGYYISTNKGATLTTQIIDANGNWKKGVSGYTGTIDDVASWVCAGDTVLYAKWTEHEYTITTAVSHAGAGSVSCGSSTTAKYVTASGDITATANAGWVFKEWQFSHESEDYDVYVSDGSTYHSTDATIRILADHDGALTAVFEPRFYLVGGEITGEGDSGSGTESGMPGWDNYTDPFNVITSSPVLATCSLTLGANKHFYIEVRDKADGYSYGKSSETLEDNETLTFTDKDNKVLFHSNGGTAYTFKITDVDGSGRPQVSVERPHAVYFGHKRVDIDGGDHNDDTGGTLTASTGGNDLSNGSWFNYGSDIKYTASPATGYTLTWYTNNTYSSEFPEQPANSWTDNNVTGDENVYAKFTEKSTAVTFSATNGKVQIASTDKANTTVGITTHREITAVPNTGYSFSSWSVPGGADFSVGSTSSATTTLSGLGTGTAGTLTANFTENIYAITISADATGGGTVSTTSVSAGIDTNPEITATPTNAAWHFKQWNCTGGASVASETSATTTVSASATGTVTAVFEPRYVLVGSLNEGGDPSGGMPSWDFSLSTGNFIVNSFTAPKVGDANITVDLSCACTLNPNKQYKFAVHDRKEGKNLGYITDNSVLPSGSSFLCNTQDRTILLNTVGAGTYTFQISQLTNDANNYPTVSVDRPTSYQSNFGWKYADGSGTLHSGDNGGTITVTASDGGSHTISSGQWVAAGANITYTASPATGYAFVGWHTDDTYVTWFSNDNPWTNSDIKAASNAYAKFVPVAVTFTNNSGSGDGKWSTASNWSPACVPTIDHDVVITKPVTVDIDHATAKSIVLDQNSNTGKLTIDANKGLEVAGTITRTTNGEDRLATRAEDLILESALAGNASLVFNNSNACAATVKMYSIGEIVSESQWNWQFMGTPFTSANALYSYYGSYLYEWKSSGDWDVVPNGGTMTPFTGYCITQSSPTTYVMDGTLNPNSDVNISIPAGKEFVMANSWTAPISVCNFTNTTLPLDDKTIYLFNTGFAPKESGDAEKGSGPGTYIAMPISSAIYTGNYLIAPMEGFYVDNRGHDAATITLKYDELVRPSGSHTDIVAGPMHAPKRVAAEAEPDVMKIKATGSRYADRVVILARQDFSTGFDNGWDGKNLNEPGVAPIIYALRADGTKDAVSAIPSFEGTVVGFRQGEDNQYTFSFDYDGEDIWYLNDLKQQKSTLIDAAHNYSFTTVADDIEARFVISATPIMNMPTDIGSSAVSDQPSEVRKIIINDQLFIIRAGRMYNAVGTLVK